MATTRKATDAAPADEPEATGPVEDPAAPVAEEAGAAPAEEARPAVTLMFTGQAQSLVGDVGLCDPGETYLVPAAVADVVCGGDHPLFVRVEAA